MRRDVTRAEPEIRPREEESALVEAAKDDGDAFAALYHRYRGPVYRYCRARSRSDEDAADLAQHVFLKAFEAIPRYEDRGLPFAAWLFRLAHNTIIDAARRPNRTVPLSRTDTQHELQLSNEPEVSALQSDAMARFQQLISSFDAERQHLLTLRFVLELPTAEIAQILGKRDSAVRAQLKRALDRLKEQQHGR